MHIRLKIDLLLQQFEIKSEPFARLSVVKGYIFMSLPYYSAEFCIYPAFEPSRLIPTAANDILREFSLK